MLDVPHLPSDNGNLVAQGAGLRVDHVFPQMTNLLGPEVDLRDQVVPLRLEG
ncbi:MAG TPA: hypothetical protein VK324_04370 [Tepidisphaeraceae bacterium]|nr:hypothetical protein [Tepidisphaeraceae bacterium]